MKTKLILLCAMAVIPFAGCKQNPGTDDPGGIVAVKSVAIDNPPAAAIEVGANHILTATVLPKNATNPKIKWSSKHETIASVDQTGKVTALAEGTATITVKTDDGGFEHSCSVKVEKPDIRVTGVTSTKPPWNSPRAM